LTIPYVYILNTCSSLTVYTGSHLMLSYQYAALHLINQILFLCTPWKGGHTYS